MSRSSRSIRRGAVAATLALALAPLAACSSGTDAATGDLKPDTANTQLGTIKVQNLTLVTGDEGSGLLALGAAFVNEGGQPETLTKVTVEGASGPAELKSSAGTGPITIPAGGAVYLAGGEKPKESVVFKNAGGVKVGDYARVTLTFGTVGETTLGVSVHAPEDYFEQLKPVAPTSAAPSSPAASPSASATSTATGAPGTPTGGPSSGAATTGTPAGAPATGSTATSATTRPTGTPAG
ncbi:hypothetical protein [Yinghuangia soli]|uniref:DUF461 domain-containing protein n=1 Tax=Yinghuangia soli TaxID=2908204 RepID=A0AA41PWJ8_9ACTN|nr:hypothetical protein [Yinghuangia soli]MCF2526897.1 hypothetical protein [Yinghuangia soli]